MNTLSDPLIDGDVDLRDFDFMPLYFQRLFSSDTWIICDFEEKVAALTLWCESWHQEPAGSLPTDDRLLSNLAGYGVAVHAWKKVRDNALTGWIPCADGRLYHPVVCQIAEDVYAKKRKKKGKLARDRIRQQHKRNKNNADIPPETAAPSDGQGEDVAATNGNVAATNRDCSSETGPPSDGQGEDVTRTNRDCPSENALKRREDEGKGYTNNTLISSKTARER